VSSWQNSNIELR